MKRTFRPRPNSITQKMQIINNNCVNQCSTIHNNFGNELIKKTGDQLTAFYNKNNAMATLNVTFKDNKNSNVTNNEMRKKTRCANRYKWVLRKNNIKHWRKISESQLTLQTYAIVRSTCFGKWIDRVQNRSFYYNCSKWQYKHYVVEIGGDINWIGHNQCLS